MRVKSKPPVLLEGCRIEQYAVRHRSIKFAGHGLLFRDGKEVGPVPRLALGRDHNNKVVLLHCNARWNVLGVSPGYSSLRAAKKRAERFYVGISKSWTRTGYTKRQAQRLRDRMGANRKCSICSKSLFEVEKILEVKKPKFAICDVCICELFALISKGEENS